MGLDPIFLIVNFIAFFLALTVHEFSHAMSAYYLGDRTAEHAGRLTLNPLAHIDLFGTVLLPLILILSSAGFVFGWAKPVPVNYYNLKDQRWGPALVSLAGPAANLIFCIVSIILFRLITQYSSLGPTNLLVNFVYMLILVNLVLMIFNLIPIPPLDGSKLLFAVLPAKFDNFKEILERNGLIILLILIIFGDKFLGYIFSFFFNLVNLFI